MTYAIFAAMYSNVGAMRSSMDLRPSAHWLGGIKNCCRRYAFVRLGWEVIRVPYRIVALHLHLARAVASGSVKAATGKVEICRDQALASDVGGDAHPMRFPLFTLARTPDQRKQVFRATYRGSEACYSVNFIRHATNITFVNSYAEIPSPVFLCIVQAVLRRLIWTSSIRSQRNITSYASFMRTDAMDEYVAELTCGAEAYRASLGKKTRFNTRYYWDRLQADFPGITALPFDRGELAHGDFAHFVSLVEKRYPGGYWSGFLPEPVFTLFRENVVGLIVRNQGKPIAFNIFYRHADDLIFTGNVFDDSYDKYSLGFVTTYMSIIQAAKQGIAKVILGGGDFGYKSRLSTASRPVSESFM